MAKIFLTSINLNGNELQNAIIHNLATLPAGALGQLAFDTAKDKLAVKASTTWKYLEPEIVAGTTAQYWRGDKSWQTLDKAAVGLNLVDNTADASKAVLSATKLATARLFSIIGGATAAGISFDGTGAVALNVTALDAAKLGGTIPAAVLGASKLYIGSTALNLNQATGTVTTLDGMTRLQVGSVYLKYDAVNNALYVEKTDGSAANFYATGENSAYGVGSGTGGGSGVSVLSALNDVAITTIANGNVLIYNSALSKWENKPQSVLIPDLSSYAQKTYVDSAISALVATAPSTLDTLNELATALGNDPNFATTITTLIGGKEATITAGTTAQYWRGDKTWQALNTTAVVEGTNQYFTTARVLATTLAGYAVGSNVALATADTILAAFGKIQAQLNGKQTAGSYQALDADLTAIAALAGTSGFLKKTAADTWALDTNSYLLSNANAVSATKLATSRNFSIAGSTGLTAAAVSFDGTGNVVLSLAGTLATANGGTGFTDAKNGITRKVLGAFVTSATSYAITHGLGTDVVAQVINVTTKEVVECDVIMTDANTTTFAFNVAPAANAYRYIIVG